jgi:ABC-type branched-subunit amino acid transport system substrate-binding protein
MLAGLELWARDAGRELVVMDDGSSSQGAVSAHGQLVEAGCDPVLGPYGGDTTRAVARARAGRVVWNHGAAADDVQRLPGVVSVSTPASRYLIALAQAAAGLGATRLAVLTAPGRFALLARKGLERETRRLGVELVRDPADAECVLVCGPVEWEAERFRDLERRGVLYGGLSPGLPNAPHVWPDGTLAPVQWHPDLGGPVGVDDYVAAQAYAAALIAEQCLELDPRDPGTAARGLATTTFFGGFELDETGLQIGHRLAVVQWRAGRQELLDQPDSR